MSSVDPGLTPAELRAWLSAVAVTEALPNAIERELKAKSGLNLFEYMVLAILSDEPGQAIVMRDLANLAFGSLSRLSHAVSRLEARGLVERAPGVGGRRHNVVSLSAAGREVMLKAAPEHIAHVRSVFLDPLDAGEVDVLGDLLLKVLATTNPELHEQFEGLVESVAERRR